MVSSILVVCLYVIVIMCTPVYMTGPPRTVHYTDTVLFASCCTKNELLTWKFESSVLYFNGLPHGNLIENVTLLANDSLFITEASLIHDGTYQCICDYILKENYTLEVQVSPDLFITLNGYRVEHDITIPAEHEITLLCHAIGAKPAVDILWEIDKEDYSPSEVNRTGSKTYNTTAGYTGQFTNDFGNISCFINPLTTTLVKRIHIIYSTYDPPYLYISMDGTRLEADVAIPVKHNITLMCHGARPVVDILWEIDGQTLYPSDVNRTSSKTYYITATYTGQLTKIAGYISCLSNSRQTEQRKYVPYTTYALPDVVISINKKRSNDVIEVQPGEVKIICHAYGSRPAAKLVLIHENQPMKEFTNISIYSTDNNVTFDTIATLHFKPRGSEGNITCVSTGAYWGPVVTYAQYKVGEITVKPTSASSEQKSYLFVMSAIFVILLVGVVGFFLHKVKSVRATAMQVNQDYSLDTSMNRGISTQSSMEGPPKSLIEQSRTSVRSERVTSFGALTEEDIPRQPDLKLPDIPKTSTTVGYSGQPDTEDVYYSSVKETATQGRIFYAKDMRLILNMKMGDLYNKWMGTIGPATDKTKCVLITTVSEIALQRKELHWDDFVKRVLEMPHNRNLPVAEGICIDAAHLYLVQEHFICETLDVRVNSRLDSDDTGTACAPLDISEIKRYVVDITEGMIAIHSYGFLHPGLSTKKILLSQQGVCKLYDFCLSEDAVKIVVIKKSKGLSTVNQLPPEALQRNEYSWASDVWSLAVMIWEIFSGGVSPFLSHEGGTDYVKGVPSPKDVWPNHLQSLENELLLSCWDTEAYFRPTVNDLKISYLKIFEAARTDETYELRQSTLMDLYVPMKGTTSHKDEPEKAPSNDE